MTDPDPFADPGGDDGGIPRDRWDRPLIIPTKRDGTPNPKGKPVPYTRASTFAKALDDPGGGFLARWQTRHAVIGVATSPDLAAMVGALGRNLNGYDAEDKKALDAIIERAHDRSGGNEKADYGTAVHALTEPGRDPFALDEGMVRDVDAYNRLLDLLGVEVIASEQFVVNDELKVAGTFDHLYRFTRDLAGPDGEVLIPAGTIVVGDKKTGSLHHGQHALQLATYARAKGYNPETGERCSLDASPRYGLLVHVPKGKGYAVAYLIDLHAGWKGAKLAVEVRAWRASEKNLAAPVGEAGPVDDDPAPAPAAKPVEPVAEFVEAVKADVETLAAVTATPVMVDASEPNPGPDVEPVDDRPESEKITERILAAKNADVEALAEPTPAPQVDEFGDPIPDPTLGVADATANIARAGLEPVGAVLHEIAQATSADECRALWSKYARINAWRPEHTEAVKRRLATLDAGQVAA